MQRKDQGVKDLKPAPGDLRLVQAFLNTADRDAGTDELVSPEALAAWLARQGLLPPGTELDEAHRQRALAVREGWRSLAAGSLNERLAEELDRLTEAAMLRGRHGVDGVVRLEPGSGGLDGALGRLLAIVVLAQLHGSWQRLKVCASAACRAAFYDRSANRSARWCRPRCGNRLSSRASKRRRRRVEREAREAKRRARAKEIGPIRMPTLAELENHPDLGRLARLVRESEESS